MSANEKRRFRNESLVHEIFIADPSAHLFNGRIYVYGSHDIDGTTPEDDLGSHFEMQDNQVHFTPPGASIPLPDSAKAHTLGSCLATTTKVVHSYLHRSDCRRNHGFGIKQGRFRSDDTRFRRDSSRDTRACPCGEPCPCPAN